MPVQSREDAPLDAQELLGVLTALKNGDFTRLMPGGQGGVTGRSRRRSTPWSAN